MAMSAGRATMPLPKTSWAAVMRRSMGRRSTVRTRLHAPRSCARLSSVSMVRRLGARPETMPTRATTATMASQPAPAAATVKASSAAMAASERPEPTMPSRRPRLCDG